MQMATSTHTHAGTRTHVIHSAFKILHSSQMFDVLQSFMDAHNITTLNRSKAFHMSVCLSFIVIYEHLTQDTQKKC